MRVWCFNLWCRAGVVALLMGGCGGVDSGGTGAVTQGTVAGLGSVVVNGVRYDDSKAVITDDDGAPVPVARVQLGTMTRIESSPVVTISGVNRATASAIHVSSDLVGQVTGIDPNTNTATVLGQTVLVTPATVFQSSITNGLQGIAGQVVEVYGRLDAANARYTATRIELRTNPPTYKVRGLIGAIDRTRQTFSIGGLDIGYVGLSPADVANMAVGKLVRVRLATAPGIGNTWPALSLASAIVALPDLDKVEVEGRITSWVSARSFSVEGIEVDATRARFDNGNTAGVVLGARVSVEGFSAGGVLVARQVEVEGDENSSNSTFEVHGNITSIDTASKTFVVLGVTVDYTGPVNYSGGTEATLAVGRNVEVHGTLSSNGTAIKANEISIN